MKVISFILRIVLLVIMFDTLNRELFDLFVLMSLLLVLLIHTEATGDSRYVTVHEIKKKFRNDVFLNGVGFRKMQSPDGEMYQFKDFVFVDIRDGYTLLVEKGREHTPLEQLDLQIIKKNYCRKVYIRRKNRAGNSSNISQ